MDGLITFHNINFANDKKFEKILAKRDLRFKNYNYANPAPWRTYTACWCAHRAAQLDGDFVECGVNTAIFSSAIVDYIDFGNLDKKFYLVDTFEGMVESMLKDEKEKSLLHVYDGPAAYAEVKKCFEGYSNIEIIKGVVPNILPMVKADKIAYLSLDMNCAYPEIEALKYFWDKLVSGAIILMDDYAYRDYEFLIKPYDDFAESKNIKILSLPCGQGMMIKP